MRCIMAVLTPLQKKIANRMRFGLKLGDRLQKLDTDGSLLGGAFGDSSGNVAVANCAAAVQDLMPTAAITFGAEAAHARTVTVTVKDAAGNALATQSHVRVWVSTASYGLPTAGNSTVGAPSAGTLMRTVEANAEVTGITEAAGGTYVFALTEPDTTNLYVMAEVGGRVYASLVMAFD